MNNPPMPEDIRARMRATQEARGMDASFQATHDQLTKAVGEAVDNLMKLMLNAHLTFEQGGVEESADIASAAGTIIGTMPNVVKHAVIADLLGRLIHEITRHYDSMLEFREAFLAGEVHGYMTKERFNEVFPVMDPDGEQ